MMGARDEMKGSVAGKRIVIATRADMVVVLPAAMQRRRQAVTDHVI